MNPTKRLFLLSSLGAALLLAGCKDAPSSAPVAAAPAANATPVSLDTIAAEAQGFSVGSTMSTRTVYVFFDPQCPHCAALWVAAKPLKSQARFVWIPVGLIGDKSVAQGATILAAACAAGEAIRGQRVGVIVSGGNVDLGRYAALLAGS